jgi:hypothetical protein
MECHWSKQIWFASSLGIVFNLHEPRYVPFSEWLKRNIIDADEDIIVHVLAFCYEIWCARNKKCFEGTYVDVTVIVQKTQRSIVNFKSANTTLLEALSRCPNLPISDVHWTPPISGFYKLNVDAAGLIEEGKRGIGVVVRDNEGVVLAASCWQVFSLPYSEVAEALTMQKGLEFTKDMCFMNLIAESDADLM